MHPSEKSKHAKIRDRPPSFLAPTSLILKAFHKAIPWIQGTSAAAATEVATAAVFYTARLIVCSFAIKRYVSLLSNPLGGS